MIGLEFGFLDLWYGWVGHLELYGSSLEIGIQMEPVSYIIWRYGWPMESLGETSAIAIPWYAVIVINQRDMHILHRKNLELDCALFEDKVIGHSIEREEETRSKDWAWGVPGDDECPDGVVTVGHLWVVGREAGQTADSGSSLVGTATMPSPLAPWHLSAAGQAARGPAAV